MTRPTPSSPFSGNSRISTFTIMPSRSSGTVTSTGVTPTRSRDAEGEGSSMPSGMRIHWRMRSSCGTTKFPRLRMRNSPTTVLVGAAQHLDDLAVGAAIALDAGDADHHAVAMHGGLG